MPLHRARIFVVRDYHQPRKGTPSSAAARSIRESTDNTARAELAELYRSGRDQAIDQLQAVRPQRGQDLER